jgi:hypothetical protein
MQRLILLLAIAGLCLPAHSAISSQFRRFEHELDRLALPVDAQHIEPVMSCLWFGLPLAARTFDSPGPIADVVRHLQKVQPLWRDVRGLPDEVVLSGDDGLVQWIARLTPADRGRINVLMSTLRLPAPGWRPKRSLNFDWLPRNARLRFDLAAADGRSQQQIWTHTLTPAMLGPILIKALNDQGWKQVGAVRGWDAPMQWARADQQLDLTLLSRQSGSAIVIRRWTRP